MSKILLRRGTTEEWTNVNPVLSQGELGVDLTTNTLKLGNGVDSWTELDPIVGGEGGGGEIDFPVDSVNGQTGAVTITLASLGGSPTGHTHTAAEVGAATTGHTHAPADIGAAAVGHTHTATQVGAIPAGDVTAIVSMTQTEYDALITKDATTLYVVEPD